MITVTSMISTRLVKKITYAGGCVVVLFLLMAIVLTVIGSRQPAPIPSVPPQIFQPIIVERIDIIPQGNVVDIVARVRNHNARAGIPQLPVTFIARSTEGVEVGRQQQTVYILPGSVQYLVAFSVPVESQATVAELDIPQQPQFVLLPEAFSLPSFSAFLRQRTPRTFPERTLEEQKGVIRNTSPLDWQSVEVVGVAVSGGDNVVGVGKTFLGELRAGEQREFTLQWVMPAQPTQQVVVLPTTNIFAEENVVRIIGDPGLLR
jgi:hypothetical protein